MLQHKSFIFLIGLIFFSLSCGKKKDTVIIDQSYIESAEYKSFQQRYKQEHTFYISDQKAVAKLIHRLVKNDSAQSFTLPFTIDTENVRTIVEKKDGAQLPMLNIEHSYYALGKFSADRITVHLFLLCKKATYDHCRIWMATKKDESVMDAKPIVEFKKNVSANIQSKVSVYSLNKISVETRRTIFYPIEQQNKNEFGYQISADGQISADKNF